MGGLRPVTVSMLLLLVSIPAAADLTKLDPLARLALARLRAGAAVEQLAAEGAAVTPDGMLDVFIRGSASRAELEAAGARVRTALPDICTASIPFGAIESVAALANVRRIAGAARAEPELNTSVGAIGVTALRGPGPGFAGLNGAGVLIGDVDTGVDFDHDDFKSAGGTTRFVSIWDQTGVGNPPPAYGFGTEWTRAQIDAGQCTEVDLNGHGTHVLGIAGGDGSQTGGGVAAFTFAGVAPMADLVAVNTTLATTSIVDGVAYCFDLATARAQNAVVNLSLGSQFGPHDGRGDFETALAALTAPGRIIVKSAGNDRGQPKHAEVFANSGPATVTLSITTPQSLIAIDGYYESTENLSVSVRTPNNTVIGPVLRGAVNAPSGQSTTNGTVYLENGFDPIAAPDWEVYLQVDAGGSPMLGTWTLTFTPVTVGPANGEVDLWRFNPTTNNGISFVTGNDPSELITEPGNTDSVITVGAFVTKQNWIGCNGVSGTVTGTPAVGNLANFSSPGPTRDNRQKPDITAPGVAIGSTTNFDTGVPVCPPSGPSFFLPDNMNHVINAGTSMAAPHVAGAVALILQNFGAVSTSWVKSFLAAHSGVDAFTGAVPNLDWGFGKLHLDTSTPTLLSMFTAEPVGAGIELRWQLSNPERYARVDLQRSAESQGPWVQVEAERHDESGVAVMLDQGAESGTTYYYRLQARTRTGELVTFGPLSATAGVPISNFTLDRVTPNPMTKDARIEFSLPHEAVIRLSILDLQGRELARLSDGMQRAGRHQATWSGGLDERRAPPGLYFIRLQTPAGSLVRRVAVTH